MLAIIFPGLAIVLISVTIVFALLQSCAFSHNSHSWLWERNHSQTLSTIPEATSPKTMDTKSILWPYSVTQNYATKQVKRHSGNYTVSTRRHKKPNISPSFNSQCNTGSAVEYTTLFLCWIITQPWCQHHRLHSSPVTPGEQTVSSSSPSSSYSSSSSFFVLFLSFLLCQSLYSRSCLLYTYVRDCVRERAHILKEPKTEPNIWTRNRYVLPNPRGHSCTADICIHLLRRHPKVERGTCEGWGHTLSCAWSTWYTKGKQTWEWHALNKLNIYNFKSLTPTCCAKRKSSPYLCRCLFCCLYQGNAVWICHSPVHTFLDVWSVPRPWQLRSIQLWRSCSRGLRMIHLRERTEPCQAADWRASWTAAAFKCICFHLLSV